MKRNVQSAMYSWNPFHNGPRWTSLIALVLGVLIATLPITSAAQGVLLTPPQLDQLVQRIALYPDPLLAQVLPNSQS